jgi:predicted phosphodiesterase
MEDAGLVVETKQIKTSESSCYPGAIKTMRNAQISITGHTHVCYIK